MADLSEFEDEIRAEIPACPFALAMNALREAIRDFCSRTWVMQENNTSLILTVANTSTHNLVANDTNSEVIGVRSIHIGDTEIYPKSRDWLDRHYPGWRTATTPSGGAWFTQTDPDSIVLAPYLQLTGGTVETLLIRQVIQPKTAVDTVPDLIRDRYKEKVCFGAKWRLLRMAGKDWADAKSAGMYMNLFYRECNKVRTQVDRSFTTEPLTARPRSRWE